MAIIVQSFHKDPYRNNPHYKEVSREGNFLLNNQSYVKCTYTRQFGCAESVRCLVSSLFSLICLNSSNALKLFKQAWNGREANKDVLITTKTWHIDYDCHWEMLHAQEFHGRKVPPTGLMDVFKGRALFFLDEEIIEKGEVLRREHIKESCGTFVDKVNVSYTKHGKAIIQQQAQRGCSAGVFAMMMMDHGKTPSIMKLRSQGLANSDYVMAKLKQNGLKTKLTQFKQTATLSSMRKVLEKKGSAIVSVYDRKIGGHFIIVDDISEDLTQVRIRDPYHGWEITVKAEAFLQRMPNQFIQVIT